MKRAVVFVALLAVALAMVAGCGAKTQVATVSPSPTPQTTSTSPFIGNWEQMSKGLAFLAISATQTAGVYNGKWLNGDNSTVDVVFGTVSGSSGYGIATGDKSIIAVLTAPKVLQVRYLDSSGKYVLSTFRKTKVASAP